MQFYIRRADRNNLTFDVFRDDGRKVEIVQKFYWTLNQCLNGILQFAIREQIPTKDTPLEQIPALLDQLENITINKEKVVESLHKLYGGKKNAK